MKVEHKHSYVIAADTVVANQLTEEGDFAGFLGRIWLGFYVNCACMRGGTCEGSKEQTQVLPLTLKTLHFNKNRRVMFRDRFRLCDVFSHVYVGEEHRNIFLV